MPAGVASALHHSARTLPPAGSSSWTPREEGLRVLAGSGEKTLPPGESSTFGDTQSARADSAPTPSRGTARIAIDGKLNTPHSPICAQRGPPPINRARIGGTAVFIFPLRHLIPTPKSAFGGQLFPPHCFYFVSHYKVLTPYGDC